MSWIELFFYLFILFVVVQFIRLILADGDLKLMWADRFGYKPGEWGAVMHEHYCRCLNKGLACLE